MKISAEATLTDSQENTVDGVLGEECKGRQILPTNRTALRMVQTPRNTLGAERLYISPAHLPLSHDLAQAIGEIPEKTHHDTHMLAWRSHRLKQQLRAHITLQHAHQIRLEHLDRTIILVRDIGRFGRLATQTVPFNLRGGACRRMRRC
jgi:hypothetical protein